jgi:hypothetical protein
VSFEGFFFNEKGISQGLHISDACNYHGVLCDAGGMGVLLMSLYNILLFLFPRFAGFLKNFFTMIADV